MKRIRDRSYLIKRQRGDNPLTPSKKIAPFRARNMQEEVDSTLFGFALVSGQGPVDLVFELQAFAFEGIYIMIGHWAATDLDAVDALVGLIVFAEHACELRVDGFERGKRAIEPGKVFVKIMTHTVHICPPDVERVRLLCRP